MRTIEVKDLEQRVNISDRKINKTKIKLKSSVRSKPQTVQMLMFMRILSVLFIRQTNARINECLIELTSQALLHSILLILYFNIFRIYWLM